MCGIVGMVSNRNASEILLSSIKKLEYRGYDSVGMACLEKGLMQIKKDAGKIDDVDEKLNFAELKGNIGIAHSRWSTHGKVTKENAHPHTDCKQKIAVVHNGIIENYSQLKEILMKKGHKFLSETDTEVIAHLIEENYNGSLKDAVLKTLKIIEGAYAIGVICTEEPDKIIAARKESPLIIGIGNGENFIASDVPAIINLTKQIIFLDNNEIAVLTKDDVKVYDTDGKEIKKEIKIIDWDASKAEKQDYEHFMLKEICEQPEAIEDTIDERIKDNDIEIAEEIGLSNEELSKINRIVIVACGTSWHAGLVGEFMLEELARINTEVEYASEFRYRNPIVDDKTLVIAISQSGETADTLAAMREAKKQGAKVISICNVKGSSIARESDGVIYTYAGPEIGVASTKAFTSQLIVLYLITIYLGKIRNVLPEEQVKNRIRDLRKIPLQVKSIIENKKEIKLLAEKFFRKTNAIYLGRGNNYPIALEGALKLKEVSYIHAEGYPAAEMKHGPIALIDEEMPVFFIATKDNVTYRKVLSNIEEVKARKGIVVAVATKNDSEVAKLVDYIIYIPENSYILTPLLAVIPFQLLAYYIAVKRGCNVDKPRNLAKSVTVE